MMLTAKRLFSFLLPLLLSGCFGNSDISRPWKKTIRSELTYLGARNWVVVAEAAFPVQSRRGIRVIYIDAEIPDLVDGIEQVIEEKHHVKPRIYVTAEISKVEYDYAPGVKYYRKELESALHGREALALNNNMLMRMLRDTSKTYRLLIIKSRTALPYSSVFMELGSGYWDEESESHLRDMMEKKEM
ncbi:MAG: hypothetical protein HN759_01140 [Akkermansiaceae bacterium]|jgi:D-ribose pyranose/furanose isomerase RbsD|nr:hypothetical protein [Akkermansiaceae bacterium]|tara:strand:- start:1573 stop:2133 length:561 start_codon:yes stop_codon:yes gene_type:complete